MAEGYINFSHIKALICHRLHFQLIVESCQNLPTMLVIKMLNRTEILYFDVVIESF